MIILAINILAARFLWVLVYLIRLLFFLFYDGTRPTNFFKVTWVSRIENMYQVLVISGPIVGIFNFDNILNLNYDWFL